MSILGWPTGELVAPGTQTTDPKILKRFQALSSGSTGLNPTDGQGFADRQNLILAALKRAAALSTGSTHANNAPE